MDDTARLKENLEKLIAILPGSRDRFGGPIIIFLSHTDPFDFHYHEVVNVLKYLCQIPDEKSRSKGFTIIVDMRPACVKYLKTILKSIQHVLCGKIQQVIVVKPEQFLEKEKVNIILKLENWGFKLEYEHIRKLSRFIDVNQLPFSFFGTYAYDHKLWIDLRLKYETFLKNGGTLLRKLETFINTNQLGSSSSLINTNNDNEYNLSDNVDDKNTLVLEADDLILKSQDLISELKADSLLPAEKLMTTTSWPNPDHLLAANRVETLAQQLRGLCDQAKGRSFEQLKSDKEKSEKILFEQFLIGVNNVTEWLLGPGEKWLLTLHEIGESRDEAEQLKRDHEHLQIKTQEIMSQIADIKQMADELISANDKKSVEVLKQRDYLDAVSKTFSMRVKHQMQVIQTSVNFHCLVDEFSTRLDELLDNLCSETTANDISSAETSIQMLEVRLNSIEKAYDEIILEGQSFLDRLHVREQNSLGYEVTRDYSPGVVHVRRTLADLDDRKQRTNQLSDVRRLKLQQILQLHTCERDADQAIKWLYELYETLVYQCIKIGVSVEEVIMVRRDLQKLEQTGRSTYEYGRQLTQISLVLRRSLRYQMSKNYELVQRLDEIWSKFCRAQIERFTRLNLTEAYYMSFKQLNMKLDEVCMIIGEEKSSLLGLDPNSNSRNLFEFVQTRKRMENLRQKLNNEFRELEFTARALVERIGQPVVTLPLTGHKDAAFVDKKAVEEIRQKLSQLENKSKLLDGYFTMADNEHSQARVDAIVRDMHMLDVNSNTNKDRQHLQQLQHENNVED